MIKNHFVSVCCGLMMAVAFATTPAIAHQNAAPDNTRANKQEQPTADQSRNNLSDRDMAAHIRRDVVKDKSLSTNAHNVKIISDHGKVTLRGPVKSEDEKHAIEEHARRYAGDGNVANEITVKSEK